MKHISLEDENGRLLDENKAISSRLKACVEASRGLRGVNKQLLAELKDYEKLEAENKRLMALVNSHTEDS